jgi:hypothetical protein
MALENFRAPPLPLPGDQYDKRYVHQLIRALTLYFNLLDSSAPNQAQSYRALNFYGGNFIGSGHLLAMPHGSYFSNVDQTLASTNTPYPVTVNQIESEIGVIIQDGSKIVVPYDGVYNFEFSAQVIKTNASAGDAFFWARVNGVNVPSSNTQVTLQGSNAAVVAAWNFMLTMNAGDFFQLMWAGNDTNILLEHNNTPTVGPAIPSVILTVDMVSSLTVPSLSAEPIGTVSAGLVGSVTVTIT